MFKYIVMGLRGFFVLAAKIWSFICYCFRRQIRAIPKVAGFCKCKFVHSYFRNSSQYIFDKHGMLKRKTLVLDLDETLIHSTHDGIIRHSVKPGTPPDFVLKVMIDRHPVRFFVHKRPHVDYFLEIVSQWYDLVVFTASMEIYGKAVADKLDNNRSILKKRYYRQHCSLDFGSYTKDLSAIDGDLSSIFILDNSPVVYKQYPDNAIPIKSWFIDATDTALLCLLPMLDALRFCNDVRSVLSRNLHLHCQWK